MTMEPMVKSVRAARYVCGTEFAHGIDRGGVGLRVLRAASLWRGWQSLSWGATYPGSCNAPITPI